MDLDQMDDKMLKRQLYAELKNNSIEPQGLFLLLRSHCTKGRTRKLKTGTH